MVFTGRVTASLETASAVIHTLIVDRKELDDSIELELEVI
jgi:hypothetical protein